MPSIQRHVINIWRLAKLKRTKTSLAVRVAGGHLIMTSRTKRFKAPQIFQLRNWENLKSWSWIQPLVILTIEKCNCWIIVETSRSVELTKILPFIPSCPNMISNVNSWAIETSLICEPLAIVTSHWSIILTLFYGHFHHHNYGVANQGVSIWQLIVMIIVVFIVVHCFMFVVENKWTIIQSALEWFVMLPRHSTSGASLPAATGGAVSWSFPFVIIFK